MSRNVLGVLLGTASLCLLPGLVRAAPEGGMVAGGVADITGQGSANVIVNQSSQRVVIDWKSFDIGAGESATFVQPNSSAIALNRITNGNPTQILGNLSANGKIVVMNANGIVFGASAKVDVAGLVATSAHVTTDSFMNDANPVFDIAGSPDAKIINNGLITVKEAGLVGLVAPQVENNGVIVARLGKIKLHGAETFTLDLAGDDLVHVAVNADTQKTIAKNSGVLVANGGTIHLTAGAARQVVDALVVNTGIIQADRVAEKNGKIILYAEGANKTGKQGSSGTLQAGTISAAGWQENETGGTIAVLGDHVLLDGSSVIVASGDTGGGDIYIGGDYLGGGDTPTSLTTFVASGSIILNDAFTNGNGGKTIVWSDDTTHFYGDIFGRGGLQGGNGGFTETSGKINLVAEGFVDLTAPKGEKGQYLLDPNDITVYGNFNPDYVSTDGTINLGANLKQWLDASQANTLTLSYSGVSLAGATASGTIGTNTITTSVNVASNLRVGARIRMTNGGVTTTADVLGPDTYTITAISGTTITVAEALTATYTNQTLLRGLVSGWADVSGEGNNVTQGTIASMPLWTNGRIEFGVDGTLESLAQTAAAGTLGTNSFYTSVIGNANVTHQIDAQTNSSILGTTGQNYILTPTHGGITTVAGSGISVGTNGISVYEHTGSYMPPTAVHNSAIGATTQSFGMMYNARRPTIYRNGAAVHTGLLSGKATVYNNYALGSSNYNVFNGSIQEVVAYNATLSGDAFTLLNQYQSAKWGTPLTPPGAGAMAADGYNVFTTDYLEKLSLTADVTLLATNTITLDLKGDILNLGNDRNIALTTTTGNIASLSAGTIQTSRTGTGGNITINAGGSVNLTNVALNAQNGGTVNVTAGDSIALGNVTGGSVFAQSGSGHNLMTSGTVTATDAGNAIVLSSGQHYINTGNLVTQAGRALIYSADPRDNTLGGITGFTTQYNRTYAANPPASIGGTISMLLYSLASDPSPPIVTNPKQILWTPQDIPHQSGDGFARDNPGMLQELYDVSFDESAYLNLLDTATGGTTSDSFTSILTSSCLYHLRNVPGYGSFAAGGCR